MSDKKKVYSAGIVTAYGAAVRSGYSGTFEQFSEAMAALPILVENLENMTVEVNVIAHDAQPSGTYADGTLTLNIPQGERGETGKSAYQYAVEGGYPGTEAEFEQLCAELGIEVGHLENMTVVVTQVASSVAPSGTYVDGTLTITVPAATDAQVSSAVGTWLDENVDPTTGYVLDRTLTQENAAAPADLVGDLKESITQLNNNIVELIDTDYFPIEKPLSWSDGYVNTDGVITSSQNSQFAVVRLLRGEKIVAGTINANISIISISEYANVSVGDSVTPICITSTFADYEEYEFTATSDCYVVICVGKSRNSLRIYAPSLLKTQQENILKLFLNSAYINSGMMSIYRELAKAWNNTTAVINQKNRYIYSNGYIGVLRGAGVTMRYKLPATTILSPAGILPNSLIYNYNPAVCIYKDGVYVNFVSANGGRWQQDASGAMEEYNNTWNVEEYNEIVFPIDLNYIDDSYMYDKTTGLIFFAGKNTPYYSCFNANEVS